MDKENVWYTNSVTVFGHKKEGNPATHKDGLEGIMLSESSQIEKNKYYRISPIRGIWKTNKLNSKIQSTGCWLTETRVASRWKGWRWSGGTSFQLLDKQVMGDEQHNGCNCCCGCSVANTCLTQDHAARQAPPSTGFPRQGYWGEQPFPSAGDLPDPGISCTGRQILYHWATSEAQWLVINIVLYIWKLRRQQSLKILIQWK